MIETSQMIPVSKFVFNPWNFNKPTDDERRELADSVRAEGVTIPIICRWKGDKLEVIDGEQKITVIRDVLKMAEISKEWVIVEEMDDSQARQYIRNSLTRSKNRNLMKEATHFYDDYKDSGLTITEYAECIGKDGAEVSRILSRVNTGPAIQDFIGKTSLPASVVDEILKTHPQYTLSYLQVAETKGWNTEQTREHMRNDADEEGKSVVENPKTKTYEKELKGMSMAERAAVARVIEEVAVSFDRVSRYLEGLKCKELSLYVSSSLVKEVMKTKNMFEGVRNIIPKDRTQPIIRTNTVRGWMLEGDAKQRAERLSEVSKIVRQVNRK